MSDIDTRRDDVIVKGNDLPRHGSPQDRGSADASTGRNYDPHYYLGSSITSDKVYMHEMTEEEIQAYKYGYENEDDRKDWG